MSFGKGNLATLSYLLETCFKEAMEAIKCVMREVMWNFVLYILVGFGKIVPFPHYLALYAAAQAVVLP